LTATVGPLPDPDHFSTITGLVAQAATRLRIDAATSEVLQAFTSAGVACCVLKGPSLAQWLDTDEDRRPYLDTDLWVRPGDETVAEATLEQLGFARRWDQSTLPDWWREHGTEWTRDRDGVLVDLHRNLPGVSADARAAWDTLAEPGGTVVIAGREERALSIPGRALHVALHCAHHGSEWSKVARDLDRALTVADEATCRQAAELARRVDALDAFAAGLRTVPAGDQLAQRLALPEPSSVQVTLRATTPPPVALGVEQLMGAASWRTRAWIIGRKVVPPREFIRHWDDRASENGWRLALAYLRRPFWLLRHTPAGVRAWWRARRRVQARH